MDVLTKCQKLRDKLVKRVPKVSCPHMEQEEQRLRAEITAEINFDEDHWTNVRASGKGQVDHVQAREISDDKEKFVVSDVLYSYHFDGPVNVWQYGVRKENTDRQVRKISVSQKNKTTELVLKKSVGDYHDIGDSSDSGLVDTAKASFTGWVKDEDFASRDIDLTDINAIRYNFRHEKDVADFMDKFVIVTPEEKEAYNQYARDRGLNMDTQSMTVQHLRQAKNSGR